MKVISPWFEILFLPSAEEVLSLVELAGRTCYKSEYLISSDSAAKFVGRIVASGHHSVIEHSSLTVRFICDRGVTHELVRHRLAAYSQESTRYANYSQERFGKQITVIRPMFWAEDSPEYRAWQKAMEQSEAVYLDMLAMGAKPQEARAVLPNSLKTDIVMTANLREWRHVIDLRCSKPAHPQIRQIMLPLLGELSRRVPVFFEDLAEKYAEDIASFASGLAALSPPAED